MVVIRLSRGGAKKRPFYHIVVSDKRRALRGRFIEQLGYFNPMPQGKDIPLVLDLARTKEWIAKGAQASDRVKNLIKMHESTEQTTAK